MKDLIIEVNEAVCTDFAALFSDVRLDEITYRGEKIQFFEDHSYSINNQHEDLRMENFFGDRQEYSVQTGSEKFPMVFQLYQNATGLYRIFVMTKDSRMLTSVNLTKGFDGDSINFGIQILITSPQKRTKEERLVVRNNVLKGLEESGLLADRKNTVELGTYDVKKKRFKNTTALEFLRRLALVAYAKREESKSIAL